LLIKLNKKNNSMTRPKIHLRYNTKITNKINHPSNSPNRNPKAQKSKKIVVDISYMCIIFVYILKSLIVRFTLKDVSIDN